MRYLLILFIAFSVNAEPKHSKEYCARAEGMARTIMEKRQREESIKSLLDDAGEDRMEKALIIAAYKTPRMASKSFKETSINSFANLVYFECIIAKN